MSLSLSRLVRLKASRELAALSCLALHDVRSQGLQFGRPVRRGHRRPQEEFRKPDGQPGVNPFVQSRATLRDEISGIEIWTTTADLFDHRHWQRTTAIGEVHAEGC